jgi:tetratricopeptide (TPR) repeat protein
MLVCRSRSRALFRHLRGPCFFIAAIAVLWLARATTFAADLLETTKLWRTGQYAVCADAAAKASEENQYNENYRLLKLRAEMELGRYSAALTTLDAALADFPQSIQLRWLGIDVCRFNGHSDRAAKIEAEIAALVKQTPGRYSDAVNQIVVGRFLLSQGDDPKNVLTGIYEDIKRRQPGYVEVYLASGDLALAKHDYQLAGEAYQEAAKLDAENADAHFGVARAFAPSDSEKAEEAIKTALSKNAAHLESLLFMVDSQIDSEQYDAADQTLARVAAVNPHHARAHAYRAVLAHLRNQPDKEKQHRAAALKHWPDNPEVDHTIGRKLSQKYRFAEGELYQRRALELDPDYLPAIEQLSQDLLRLGREDEGWKLAEQVYEADGYNVLAHNLVTLRESLMRFRTIEADGLVLRMDAREADIYGQQVLALLKRAREELCAKYDVTLPGPVIVELFPKQQDFAIRTFGLPGGAGFLGVCFGSVITANSPASQGASPSCWEATLWHEFCHVVTLNKTNNKMPRWLSEGISVYEERQENRTWGQTMTPQYRQMLLGDELTPVSQLSGAFLSPKSPVHLQFAYYESSLAVEYLIEKYGIDTLKRVLVDLGAGLSINESLGRYTGSLAALDTEFAAYARQKANDLAPQVDWSEPELRPRAAADVIDEYVKQHPSNYIALLRQAQQRMKAGQWQAAKEPLFKMRELFPTDAGANNPHALLGQVHRELKEMNEELAALEKLAELSCDDVEMLSRLAELTAAAGQWEKSRDYARRWLAVNPLIAPPHRRAASAAEALEDDALAIASYRALLLLAPFDAAQVHLDLAAALARTGELPVARTHALLALEETPRFRAAQRKLIEIVEALEKQNPQMQADPPAAAAKNDPNPKERP